MMRQHRIIHTLLAAALAAGLAAPLPAAAAGTSSFQDVTDPATAVNADILRLMGVVAGTGNNTFQPNTVLTRAQFCTMAVNFMGLEDQVVLHSTRTIFTDVPASHWARGYINLAASTGVGSEDDSTPLIAGVGDGRFLPDQALTYAQAVTILIRVLGYTGDQVGAVWPDGYLNLAESIGLSQGVQAGANDSITRAQAAQLFVNALDCKTGGGREYYTTLGGEVREDTILLAVNAETDDGSALGAVRTSNGTYLPDAEDAVPTALVGRRGALVLNEDSEIVTFVPDDSDSASISLRDSAEPSYLTASNGQRYTVSGDTPVYTSSSSDSKPYSEGYLTLTAGSRVTLFTLRGKVTALYVGSSATDVDAGAVVVTNGSSPAVFHNLTGGASGYTVLKNQQEISLSQIQPYDVVTYDSMSNTLLVSDLRLTCKYQNPSPNAGAPTSIELLGHTFPVLESAWDFTGQVSVGDQVSLLLTVDGQVAGIVPVTSQTRSTALGLVTSATTAELFLPNGGSLELTGAESNLRHLNLVCSLSSSDENKLSASRFTGQSASGDFDPSAMTVGRNKVAPGVRVYEQFRDGPHAAVPLSSLDFGVIPQEKIKGVHLNSSGVVDLIVLDGVTGDAYLYGRMVGSSAGSGSDRTVWKLENHTSHAIAENSGYAGRNGGFAGIALNSKNFIVDVLTLTELEHVSASDFFERDGRYYLTFQGRTYPVASDVECFRDATESWFSQADGLERLRACLAFSNDLTAYIDPVGGKVRILVAN